MSVKVLILTGYGINAEKELAWAFEKAGGVANVKHLEDVIENPSILDEHQILAFPGGFSYGDHIASGKVFGNKIKFTIFDKVQKFIDKGNLVIGICNGFQIITKLGLVPNYDNKYDLQLSFGPFLQIVDSYDLLRQKDELIVKNALNPINGKREDISIPLDPHGRMLINFRRGAADDAFNHCSIIQIIDLDLSETAMIECLKNITIQEMFDENGYELVPLTHAKQIIQQYFYQLKNFALTIF